jgi:hypothetical protein
MILSEENINGYEICVYESTNIVKSMYSVSEEKLIVKFGKGGEYSYTPVNESLYLHFKTAESQGKFFRSEIQSNKEIIFEHLNKVNKNEL